MGAAGALVQKLLLASGMTSNDCYKGYVCNARPQNGNVKALTLSLNEAKKIKWHLECPYPKFEGRFASPALCEQLERLKEELISCSPNVAVALGPFALWALTGLDKIGSYRGTPLESTLVPGLKVIGVYGPEAIIKIWTHLPVALSDFKKAARQSKYPEIQQKVREVWIEPTIEDLETFYSTYIHPLEGKDNDPLSWDIETKLGHITCIGFAPTDTISIVVPFVDTRKPGGSYWKTKEEEIKVWKWVDKILGNPHIHNVLQNCMYDIQWIYRKIGIKTAGNVEDTMIMQHALQPELPKGLGFLASFYTDQAQWKTMMKFGSSKGKKEA